MKTQLSLVLAIVCALFITACGGGGTPAQPVAADLNGFTLSTLEGTGAQLAQKFSTNGNLTEQGYVVNGSRSGQWLTYNQDGKIATLTSYIAGLKNGTELKFNNRGQIETQISYKNDKLDGIYGTYKGGRAEQEVSYRNGVFDGPTTKYFSNGKLQQEIHFKDGKQHGPYRYYDEEGNVTLEYEYKNGEKVSGGMVEKR